MSHVRFVKLLQLAVRVDLDHVVERALTHDHLVVAGEVSQRYLCLLYTSDAADEL